VIVAVNKPQKNYLYRLKVPISKPGIGWGWITIHLAGQYSFLAFIVTHIFGLNDEMRSIWK